MVRRRSHRMWRLIPGLATYSLLTTTMRRQERQYLEDLGVAPADLEQVNLAMWAQGTIAPMWMFAVVVVTNNFALPGLGPALFSIPTNVALLAVIPAAFMAIMALSTRARLLASAARCARLLCVLAPTTPLRGLDVELARWLESPAYRRRRVAAVAWALTRDTARLSGRAASAGATVGELLLWFGENPADKRRRPIVGPYLAELMIAAARETPIPHAQFAPASRCRSRSPRELALRQLRTTVTSALATGVLLAVVVAVLRVWLK